MHHDTLVGVDYLNNPTLLFQSSFLDSESAFNINIFYLGRITTSPFVV